MELVDVASVSGDERVLADAVEACLRGCAWLEVSRLGNTVIARTNFGRASRVIVAGHLDTVPAAGNEGATLIQAGQPLPHDGSLAEEDLVFGLGACDMKGGVAVALRAAVTLENPQFDVTYIFYECEEVDSARNGLTILAAQQPDLLKADVAVLLEPSNSQIEAGCQGTLRAHVRTTGVRSHSARSWLGDNAIHHLGEALRRLSTYEPTRVVIDGLEYREGLNAVGISGGIAGNVIPDEAMVEVNYRYAPSKSAEQAAAHVTDVFEGFEVVVVDNASGALPGLTQDALAELVRLVDGQVAPKFGWTDVARFAAMGVPAVNLGPGDPGLAHSRGEFVTCAQLQNCEATIFSWLAG
jgi:succinyl-diaminopimelate desuccinylase